MTGFRKRKEEPIRVLHVTGLAPAGGVLTVLMCYFNTADPRVSQSLIYSKNRVCEELEELARRKNGNAYRLPNLKLHPFHYVRELCKFYKRNSAEFDVIHIHAPNIGLLDALLARLFGCRHVIVHSHTSGGTPNIITRVANYVLCRFTILFANHYLACSVPAGLFLFGRKQFHTLYNSINVDQYAFSLEKRAYYLDQLAIAKSDDVKIVHVGSLIQIKNQKFLIRVMDHIVNKQGYKHYVLCLVGDGVMRVSLEEMIAQFHLEKNVFLLGQRKDVHWLLSSFDIFVLPSFSEGFPLSLLEAQANGLPCVVSDKVPESVARNSNLRFLSVSDVDAVSKWSNCIVKGNLRRESDTTLIRKNLEPFRESSIYNELYEYYESIVE